MNIVYGIGILLLIGLWVFVRRRESKAAETPAPRTTAPRARPKVAEKSTPYHAVSIKFAPSACEAAKALKEKRFLSGAAPRLPLPDCDVLECKCRFVHHSDRRSGSDRRAEIPRGFGADETGSYSEERRQQTDRRKPDEDDFSF